MALFCRVCLCICVSLCQSTASVRWVLSDCAERTYNLSQKWKFQSHALLNKSHIFNSVALDAWAGVERADWCLDGGSKILHDWRQMSSQDRFEEEAAATDRIWGTWVNVAANILSNITRTFKHRVVRLGENFHNFTCWTYVNGSHLFRWTKA